MPPRRRIRRGSGIRSTTGTGRRRSLHRPPARRSEGHATPCVKAISPTRRAPRESAAIPETATSTGWPAARAACRVGMLKGSTATTRARPSAAAATPAYSPPPPTATMIVSMLGSSGESPRRRCLHRPRFRADRTHDRTGHRFLPRTAWQRRKPPRTRRRPDERLPHTRGDAQPSHAGRSPVRTRSPEPRAPRRRRHLPGLRSRRTPPPPRRRGQAPRAPGQRGGG